MSAGTCWWQRGGLWGQGWWPGGCGHEGGTCWLWRQAGAV